MIVSLRNEHLTIEFFTKGAELKSIVGIDSAVNYMWRGDSQFWGKFSPVLFPIVGALKENSYTYDGNRYTLPRHGFARDMEFEHELISATEVLFKLQYSEETLKIYPFKFELTLRYRLKGSSLKCTYHVVNRGDQPMLFSIGGHPAFAVPLHEEGTYADYYLQFNHDDELTYHHIEDNLISDQTTTIELQEQALPLKHELFYGDALVFKKLKSNQVRLLNTKNYKGLNFHFEGFPYFGIWAAIDADFVCLEPWCGIADGINHNQKLEEKEGVEKLEAGENWERSWEVCCF